MEATFREKARKIDDKSARNDLKLSLELLKDSQGPFVQRTIGIGHIESSGKALDGGAGLLWRK